MSFRQFQTLISEAKFRRNSPEVVRQVKSIASTYFNQYNSNNVDLNNLIEQEKVISFKENRQYRKYFKEFSLKKMPTYFTPVDNLLGKVSILDLETNEKKTIDVYCVYGDIGDTEQAAYSQEYEAINIYDENIKGLSEALVQSKILHELTHGFQEYKGQTKKYQQMIGKERPFDWDVYHKEPIEFDTHINEIAYNINVKYKDFVKSILTAKDPAVKKLLKMRLQTFIKELKVFTEAPLESYLDLEELPLPRYTQTLEEFLRTINQDKKLWNKFKQKVSRLYEKLKIQADRLIRKG